MGFAQLPLLPLPLLLFGAPLLPATGFPLRAACVLSRTVLMLSAIAGIDSAATSAIVPMQTAYST